MTSIRNGPPRLARPFQRRFRTSAPVSKTGGGDFLARGFESLPLRFIVRQGALACLARR
jgi:hypothetical protein